MQNIYKIVLTTSSNNIYQHRFVYVECVLLCSLLYTFYIFDFDHAVHCLYFISKLFVSDIYCCSSRKVLSCNNVFSYTLVF